MILIGNKGCLFAWVFGAAVLILVTYLEAITWNYAFETNKYPR